MAERAILLLSHGDLVKFAADLQIAVTIEDLKESKSETMLMIYDAFVRDLEEGTNSPQQFDFHGIEFMEDPDLHRNSARILRIQLSLQKISRICGLKDFTMADIVNPNPKQTRRILSHLQNYYVYWATKLGRFEDLQARGKEMIGATQELIRKKSDLNSIANKKLLSIQALKSQCLPEELKAVKDDFITFEEEKKKLTEDYGALKQQVASAHVLISAKNVEQKTLEEKKQDYLQQIVHSPERIGAECQQLNSQIETMISEQKKCRERCQAISGSLENLQKLNTELEELNELIHFSVDQAKEIQQYKEKSLENEKQIQAQTQQLTEMPSKMEHAKQKLLLIRKSHNKEAARLNREKEALKTLFQQKEKKLQEVQKAQAQNLREHEDTYEEMERLSHEIAKTKAEIEKIEKEEAEVVSHFDRKVEEYLEKISEGGQVMARLDKMF